jgi:DNA-binding response OmpR family regulator
MERTRENGVFDLGRHAVFAFSAASKRRDENVLPLLLLRCSDAMNAAKKTILIIEDEPHIVMGLRDALEFEGFKVLSSGKGREGVQIARTQSPDAVILDLMLPDMNGYAVCEEIRRSSPFLPIVMLTARSQETDKIRGLDAGADDYVTKPFSVNELIARIRAIFRRVARPNAAPDMLEIGEAKVSLAAHTLRSFGEDHQLSFYEVELLKMLYERAGQAVSRDEILQRIWGLDASPTNRTVDNFIVKLRKKIERSPDKPAHILTVYGFGYKLVMGPTGSSPSL